MKKINSRQSTKLKIYNEKMKLSSLLWFLAGLGVLAFGIYFIEIFEILLGLILILISIVQMVTKNKTKNIYTIQKREKGKFIYLLFAIVIISLINPLGLLPIIYDLYKRDWVLDGGLDEE